MSAFNTALTNTQDDYKELRNFMKGQEFKNYNPVNGVSYSQQTLIPALKAVWTDPVAEACKKLDETIVKTNAMLGELAAEGKGGNVAAVVKALRDLLRVLNEQNKDGISDQTEAAVVAFIGGVDTAINALTKKD